MANFKQESCLEGSWNVGQIVDSVIMGPLTLMEVESELKSSMNMQTSQSPNVGQAQSTYERMRMLEKAIANGLQENESLGTALLEKDEELSELKEKVVELVDDKQKQNKTEQQLRDEFQIVKAKYKAEIIARSKFKIQTRKLWETKGLILTEVQSLKENLKGINDKLLIAEEERSMAVQENKQLRAEIEERNLELVKLFEAMDAGFEKRIQYFLRQQILIEADLVLMQLKVSIQDRSTVIQRNEESEMCGLEKTREKEIPDLKIEIKDETGLDDSGSKNQRLERKERKRRMRERNMDKRKARHFISNDGPKAPLEVVKKEWQDDKQGNEIENKRQSSTADAPEADNDEDMELLDLD